MNKLYKAITFILLWVGLVFTAHSQSYTYYTIPTAANGTSGSGRGPITNSAAHRSCAVYVASEFTGMINAGDSIFRVGFVINNPNTVTSAVAGTIKIYMVNTSDAGYLRSTTWSTLLTTPTAMDTNYNGSMTIPATTGPFFVTLSKPFVYTGGGIYLAYEWTVPSPAAASMIYSCNTNVANGQRNIQGASLTTLTTLTGVSSFRAQLYLGVKTPTNDAKVVETYSLGKLPIPFGAPHTVKARVKNVGSDTLLNRMFYLTVGPVNTFSDSLMIDSLLPNQEKTVSFASYIPSTAGMDTVKVFCGNDNNNSNNLRKYGQIVNLNTYNYADPLIPAAGGVGFTGATGDFVAKFPYTGSNSINQIGVNFNTGGNSLKVGIWDTSATGTPGTLLWSSAAFTTSAGLNTIPVNPPVPISGTFFVGVIQTGTVNAAFSYQSEAPIRGQTFYYTSPTGSTTWTDFLTTASNFRFMIEPRLQLANDLGSTGITAPCDIFPQGQGSVNPSMTVYNYGSNTQFSVKVKTRIYNAANAVVYTDSANIGFILPGTSQTITLSSVFNPTTAGVYTVKSWTELSGDGDLNNDTATKVISVLAPVTSFGSGTRLQFDGVNDNISIANNPATNPSSNFTIETWIRPSSLIAVGTIYSKDSTVNDSSLTITLSGTTPVVTMKTTSGYYVLSSTVGGTVLSWTHIALTYNGTNLKLYVNGQLGIDTIIFGDVVCKQGPTYLGMRAGAGSPLNAGIENYMFWNTVRTQDQIRLGMHYKYPQLSNVNLLTYFRFDEGANANLLADGSGNCNVGMMNNFDLATAWFISSLPLDTSLGQKVTFSSSAAQSFSNKNVSMSFQNMSGSHDVVVHYFKYAALGFTPDTVLATSPKTAHNRFWVVYKYGSATYDSCYATFQLPAGNLGAAATAAQLNLAVRDNGASGLWTLARNPADAFSVPSQTVSFWLPSVNTFEKQYGIASSGTTNPLPVKYAWFKGTKTEEGVKLNWATAAEMNSSHFIVERSLNGSDFEAIGQLQAKGNSTKIQNYAHLDAEALNLGATQLYYRLLQVDLDGTQEYSQVIVINLDEDLGMGAHALMPNPFTKELALVFTANKDVQVKIDMLNIKGELIFSKTINSEAGFSQINLDEAGDLAHGMYLVRLQYEGKTEVHKVVKLQGN